MCKTNVFYEIVWKYSLTQKALRQAQRLRKNCHGFTNKPNKTLMWFNHVSTGNYGFATL